MSASRIFCSHTRPENRTIITWNYTHTRQRPRSRRAGVSPRARRRHGHGARLEHPLSVATHPRQSEAARAPARLHRLDAGATHDGCAAHESKSRCQMMVTADRVGVRGSTDSPYYGAACCSLAEPRGPAARGGSDVLVRSRSGWRRWRAGPGVANGHSLQAAREPGCKTAARRSFKRSEPLDPWSRAQRSAEPGERVAPERAAATGCGARRRTRSSSRSLVVSRQPAAREA